jgi:hypothetical protein
MDTGGAIVSSTMNGPVTRAGVKFVKRQRNSRNALPKASGEEMNLQSAICAARFSIHRFSFGAFAECNS